MDLTSFAAAVFAVLALPATVVIRLALRWRGGRRNAADACAGCGVPWAEVGVAPARFHVEGHEMCASCAHRGRRRLVAGVAALGAVTAAAVVVAAGEVVAGAALSEPAWALALVTVPPLLVGGATWAALRRMRRLNEAVLAGGADRGLRLPESAT